MDTDGIDDVLLSELSISIQNTPVSCCLFCCCLIASFCESCDILVHIYHNSFDDILGIHLLLWTRRVILSDSRIIEFY